VPQKTKPGCVLLIPDTHAPFHDAKAWRLAMQVGRYVKPDHVIVLGDFVDCYAISKFTKERRGTLAEEIAVARGLLDDLESLAANRYSYICGNHEFRYPKYIADRAPELAGIVPAMREMLGLGKHWSWTDYHDLLRIGHAHFTHDVGGAGATAHMKAALDVGGNVAIGHTHHMGIHYRGTLKGSAFFGAALGCLADRTKVDYMHRARTAHWVHGVGVGYLRSNGDFHLQAVPFVNGCAVVNGTEIVAAAQRRAA
jgi:predicted phosphodiesterase